MDFEAYAAEKYFYARYSFSHFPDEPVEVVGVSNPEQTRWAFLEGVEQGRSIVQRRSYGDLESYVRADKGRDTQWPVTSEDVEGYVSEVWEHASQYTHEGMILSTINGHDEPSENHIAFQHGMKMGAMYAWYLEVCGVHACMDGVLVTGVAS